MSKRWWFGVIFVAACVQGGETFTVATFNVENYFLTPFGTRKAKSEASRAKVAEVIARIRPDVLALQEMGRPAALKELEGRLDRVGLRFPHQVWVDGPDPAIHLVVLSRFPIVTNRSKGRVDYLLDQRRFQMSRGVAEVVIQVNEQYRFILFNALLKSKRPVAVADQAAMRLEEARQLRQRVAARLQAEPDANLLVGGDLNDTPNTDPIREIVGRRGPRLMDLRPVEDNGDSARPPRTIPALLRDAWLGHTFIM